MFHKRCPSATTLNQIHSFRELIRFKVSSCFGDCFFEDLFSVDVHQAQLCFSIFELNAGDADGILRRIREHEQLTRCGRWVGESGGENDDGFGGVGDYRIVEVEVDGGEVGNGITGVECCFGLDAITNEAV